MFISPAYAAETTAQFAGNTNMIIQLVLIMLVFYLFLIRPQQKKIKQHEQLLQTIKKGDRIITGGGLIAKVTDASDPYELKAEIANGVEVTVYRATVRDLLTETEVKEIEKNEKKVARTKKDAKATAGAANSNKKSKN